MFAGAAAKAADQPVKWIPCSAQAFFFIIGHTNFFYGDNQGKTAGILQHTAGQYAKNKVLVIPRIYFFLIKLSWL
ncbi:hypothetical protein DWUX_541 [Desulfovibrio diazotrophicus]|nr:hypothetical protein DWUX_541 [Desulfovibrio diazotrophicus]VVU42773.1 hypothetical protein DWUX_119 [Desulfovibrio diazotrophicus]